MHPNRPRHSGAATNSFTQFILGGNIPSGVAVTPDGSKVYVTFNSEYFVGLINTATNSYETGVDVGGFPFGLAVTPDGSRGYVANQRDNTVSVFATATNMVIGSPIAVGTNPFGVAITPDGSKVYVTNEFSNTVSVIATATNTVTGSPISVGNAPIAFGNFVGPAPKFAGTPGQPNCNGKSVSALAKKYGTLEAAAQALGYPSVQALKNAIESFCGQ